MNNNEVFNQLEALRRNLFERILNDIRKHAGSTGSLGRLQPGQYSDLIDWYGVFEGTIVSQYQELQGRGMVFRFTDADPYKSSQDMFRDVERYACLNVFRGDGPPVGHPMHGDANLYFRGVHDIIGHYENRYGFGPGGELAAFARHAQTMSSKSLVPLYLETISQQAEYWTRTRPDFPPQRTYMPDEGLVDETLRLGRDYRRVYASV